MNDIVLYFLFAGVNIYFLACGLFILVTNYFDDYSISNEEEMFFSDYYKNEIIKKKYELLHIDIDDNDITTIARPNESNEEEFKEFFKKNSVHINHNHYGDMYMFWDKEDNIYYYYANVRDIPYVILDVLCRKFVLTYDLCDYYSINFNNPYENEIENYELIMNEKTEMDSDFESESDSDYEKILNETHENETQENENQDKDKDVVVDVFASFKKYGNKKNNEKIEKSINNFKYSGNINDFNDLNKDTKQEEPLELTYQQYKIMKEKNKID